MADAIIKCERTLKNDDSIEQYEFTYSVEYNGLSDSFCVVIKAAAMQNPASESEARSLANAEASTKKAQWMAQHQSSSSEDLSFLTGIVEL